MASSPSSRIHARGARLGMRDVFGTHVVALGVHSCAKRTWQEESRSAKWVRLKAASQPDSFLFPTEPRPHHPALVHMDEPARSTWVFCSSQRNSQAPPSPRAGEKASLASSGGGPWAELGCSRAISLTNRATKLRERADHLYRRHLHLSGT